MLYLYEKPPKDKNEFGCDGHINIFSTANHLCRLLHHPSSAMVGQS